MHLLTLLCFALVLLGMPGRQQRMQKFDRDREGSRSPGDRDGLGYGRELRDWLVSWSWGSSTAADVVRRADAKKKSGQVVDQHIKRLASCSSDNKIGNAERMVESIAPSNHFPPTQRWGGSVNDGIFIASPCFSLDPRNEWSQI